MCDVYVGHEFKRGTVGRKYNYLWEGRDPLDGEEVIGKGSQKSK